MRINHNIAALNTQNQLGQANKAQQNSMEKLSSGLRINSASDDAAGLAISEKMRGQIRGLEQAETNAQDANSMIQTAEGALNESHSILQRMRELATQSSNDTNTSGDREKIQEEVNELTSELDRIAKDTEFNTQKLLDGSFNGKFQIGANEGQSLDLSISGMGSADLGLNSSSTVETGVTAGGLEDGTYTVNDANNVLDSSENIVGTLKSDDATTVELADSDGTSFSFSESVTSDSTITVKDGKADLKKDLGTDALSAGTYEVDDSSNLIKNGQIVGELNGDGDTITELNGEELADDDEIGINELGFDEADASLGNGDSFTINGVDVSSGEKASGSITAINDAIETVSSQRSQLGAVQNRLDHTINNLSTSSENLTAAESRIRDVDMAEEMMNQTKSSILSQASQSMLAQSRQLPKSA